MLSVEPVEYVIELSTGETLLVSELDPESVPALADGAVRKAAEAALSRCTVCPRDVLEDAKRGHTAPLEALLRTPPAGCLLRLRAPECREIGFCVSADRAGCSTAAGGGSVPPCWTFRPGGDPMADPASLAASVIGTAIVHAWAAGRYVVLVGDPGVTGPASRARP